MKSLLAILLIGISGYVNLYAQSLRYPLSLPYISLNTYSKEANDPFSFTSNQAALASVKNPMAGVYAERRFLLAATSAYRFAGVLPSRYGNFGLQLDYAGFKNFNESRIGLAYGRSLGSKIDLGIQFNYYGYRVPAYGNAGSIYFEAGALFHFTEKLHGGFHVYNPVGGKLSKTGNEKMASVYAAGLGFDASPGFFAGCELIKEEDRPLNVLSGFQYHFSGKFFIRAGVISESGSVFAGAGAGWNKLRLDVSASYHPQLGFSPGILLVAGLGREK